MSNIWIGFQEPSKWFPGCIENPWSRQVENLEIWLKDCKHSFSFTLLINLKKKIEEFHLFVLWLNIFSKKNVFWTCFFRGRSFSIYWWGREYCSICYICSWTNTIRPDTLLCLVDFPLPECWMNPFPFKGEIGTSILFSIIDLHNNYGKNRHWSDMVFCSVWSGTSVFTKLQHCGC